jgi:CHAT domain-containing protein/tetratricopeptide (TPR) repeat protein
MRLTLALSLVLFLAGCGDRAGTLDSELQETRRLMNSEQYTLAETRAESGMRLAAQHDDGSALWRFRLLHVDSLLGQRKTDEARAQVAKYGEPPAAKDWDEIRGRLALAQGRIAYAKNQDAEAAAAFRRAADLASAAHAPALVAEASLRDGLLLIRQQKMDEARARFESLADAGSALGDAYLRAVAVGNVGFVLQRERRYEDAIPWFERAVSQFAAIGATESVARNQGNLATCYWGLGDYDNAELHYKITEAGFAKTGNRDSQQIWIGNAANVRYEVGDYVGAAAGYLRALELARAVGNKAREGLWLANLAATSIELGRWNSAESYNSGAAAALRSAGEKEWDLLLAVNAARIEEGKGQTAEARALFEKALRTEGDDAAARLDTHAGLARLSARDGKAREAETQFRAALRMIEAQRQGLVKDDYKVSYLASLIRFYREYVDFLIANHQPERALEVADSSRARLLEEPRTNGATKQYSAADYKRVARVMHATLFEYLLGPEKSYLWVVDAGGVELHVLPSRGQLRPLIERYRAVVGGGRNPLESAGETGRKLYEMLLAPGVKGAGRYMIVPDEDLYSFSLETLPKAGEPGKFWIDEATVGIAPSLSYLAGRSSPAVRKGAKPLLAIGDAASSGPQYPKLEFAGQEITAISTEVGGAGNLVLRGEAATPAAYSRATPGRFGYIHFAAHAAANRQSPLDSAVLLSGPPDKSRLMARDVMAMPLTADLVTISACRSAGGKTYAGEGLVGFAWAFLRAGARNVIAGLWDVSDRSTAQLMTALYGEIARGTPAPEALRAAKLRLIAAGGAYAKPYYWAPFHVYVGGAE